MEWGVISQLCHTAFHTPVEMIHFIKNYVNYQQVNRLGLNYWWGIKANFWQYVKQW
jgi:hypothetical protein